MLRELRGGDQSPGLRSPAQQSLGAALDQAAGGSPVRRVSSAWSAAQLAVRSHAEHATAPPQTHPWAGNTPFECKAGGSVGGVSSIAGSDAGGANSEPPTPSRWTIGGGSYVAAVSPARLPPPLPSGLLRVLSPMRAAAAAAPTSPARSTSSSLSASDLQRCSACSTASALCKLQQAQVCARDACRG